MKQSENRRFSKCETLFRYMPSVSLAMSSTPRENPSQHRFSKCFACGRDTFVVRQKYPKPNQGCPLNPARAIRRQVLRPNLLSSARSKKLPEPRSRFRSTQNALRFVPSAVLLLVSGFVARLLRCVCGNLPHDLDFCRHNQPPRVKPSKRRALLAASEKPYKPSPVRRRWRVAPDEVKCQANTTRVADNHTFVCLMKECFTFGRGTFVVRQKYPKPNQGCPLNPARAIRRQVLRPNLLSSARSKKLPEPRSRFRSAQNALRFVPSAVLLLASGFVA